MEETPGIPTPALGCLGPVLGMHWAVLGLPWAVFGVCWAVLALLWAVLGASWSCPGLSGTCRGLSWAYLGPVLLVLGLAWIRSMFEPILILFWDPFWAVSGSTLGLFLEAL